MELKYDQTPLKRNHVITFYFITFAVVFVQNGDEEVFKDDVKDISLFKSVKKRDDLREEKHSMNGF